MAKISKKTEERLRNGLKRFQPIISSARARDLNESDTVVIITDVLSELFGYDKYTEITTEHSIRGTFCDLAIKLGGKVSLLIEVKAIGLDLKDAHIKQAIDYAANEGVEWVILTNGMIWKVFHVTFSKPIAQELILDVDLLAINPKDPTAFENLSLLTKEGWEKTALAEYHEQIKTINKFTIASLLLTEPVLSVVRREIKRLSPGIRIEISQIESLMKEEVLKREVVEGEKADEARKKVHRALGKALRVKKSEPTGEDASIPDENEKIEDDKTEVPNETVES